MEVELPDGQIAEFPDGTPHEKIESAIKNHFKATPEDKSKAYEQIKKRFPGMPDFIVKGLMPIATKMAETPEDKEPGTATGAFLRSAVRTPLEGAENLASLVGLPVDKGAKFPGIVAESLSDTEHPFAQGAGALAGAIAPGAAGVTALRSIPMWGNIIRNIQPSIMAKLLAHGMEGAGLGAGFSPEGERGKGAALGAATGAATGLLPIVTNIPAVRKLNRARSNLQEHGINRLDVGDHIIDDIERNNYLRDNQANRNLLERARTGNYQGLFNLQSDLGGLQRRYGNDWFSSAQRELGRDIGHTRQDLLNSMRHDIGYQGRPEDAELMRAGQQQYRQHMQLLPWRNKSLLALIAGIPGYHYAKKLIP